MQWFLAAIGLFVLEHVFDVVPYKIGLVVILFAFLGYCALWLPEHAAVGLLQLLQCTHHQQPLIVLVVVLERVADEIEVLLGRFIAVDHPRLFFIVVVEVGYIGF